MPERGDHVAVVDAGAHDLAEAGALDDPPQDDADHQGGAEHDHAAEEAEPHVARQVDAVGQSVGVLMSLEMPPKAASIWSAKITESAIVISAWRRSWPWFQRRNTCWMTTPMIPMMAVASSSGTSQPSREYRCRRCRSSERPRPASSLNQASWHLQAR